MAEQWIKMRVTLVDDPKVIQVAQTIGTSNYEVVGLLHSLWSWADGHTSNGNASGISGDWVDKYLAIPGAANALVEVGWLLITENGINLPNFTQHNGAKAKTRAMSAKRTAKHRAKAPTKPARAAKKTGPPRKVAELFRLLRSDGTFHHLVTDVNKSSSLKLWVEHLNERLATPYTARGAASLLKKIDAMDGTDFTRAVEFSLEGNYQKLIDPGNSNGNTRRSYGKGVRSRTRPEEYTD